MDTKIIENMNLDRSGPQQEPKVTLSQPSKSTLWTPKMTPQSSKNYPKMSRLKPQKLPPEAPKMFP
jgi:hypothetical protein